MLEELDEVVAAGAPNDLELLWMPFTANRQFKSAPRILVAAEGMHYCRRRPQILDGSAGLWCVNPGHCRPKIVEAVQQAGRRRWTSRRPSTWGIRSRSSSPSAWPRSRRSASSRVFFTNSGSESADTALKIALAYHRARGEGQRIRLIGRERGYHGVNFGGMAVGGIPANRKAFGPGVAGVDHIRHTHDLQRNAFSQGPAASMARSSRTTWSALCTLHDPSTIAAVIVEPVAGSAGVLVAAAGLPRSGCARSATKHGILLIFDEVITGFGRLGHAVREPALRRDARTCSPWPRA